MGRGQWRQNWLHQYGYTVCLRPQISRIRHHEKTMTWYAVLRRNSLNPCLTSDSTPLSSGLLLQAPASAVSREICGWVNMFTARCVASVKVYAAALCVSRHVGHGDLHSLALHLRSEAQHASLLRENCGDPQRSGSVPLEALGRRGRCLLRVVLIAAQQGRRSKALRAVRYGPARAAVRAGQSTKRGSR